MINNNLNVFKVSLEFCRNLLSVVGNSWSKEWDCADAIVSAFEKVSVHDLCQHADQCLYSYIATCAYKESEKHPVE